MDAKRRTLNTNKQSGIVSRARISAHKPGSDALDQLAGAWTRAQARAFNTAIAPFGEIDYCLWNLPASSPGDSQGSKRAQVLVGKLD